MCPSVEGDGPVGHFRRPVTTDTVHCPLDSKLPLCTYLYTVYSSVQCTDISSLELGATRHAYKSGVG